MKISVKKKHIETAKCGDPYQCMIAEAIRDGVAGVSYVRVKTNGITITQRKGDGKRTKSIWMVPLVAARAIIRFDRGEPVLPFTFSPKLVAKQELEPRSPASKQRDRDYQRKKRAKMRVVGKDEVWRQRVAGV